MSDMTIGKVARAADVGVETVRFYQRKGLLDQPLRPRDGGYRVYPPETVARIRFIRDAQRLGFTLGEIDGLLTLRTDPTSDCARVRALAEEKRRDVLDKIAGLERIRAALDVLIAACPGRGSLRDCTILEALSSGQGGSNCEEKTENARQTPH